MEEGKSKSSLRVHKKGIRAFGIAESFVNGENVSSVLAGVVLRADMILDGFAFNKAMVGGMDATQKIVEMYTSLERDDVNVLLLNGCVISWYNVVDLNFVSRAVGLPLVCVTYEDSGGLEKFFKENFPEDWKPRVEIYHSNGPRKLLKLHTGSSVYVRSIGLSEEETIMLLNKFTLNGSVPEPLRIAQLLARNFRQSKLC